MHHLIIGYGYSAYYLARWLTNEGQSVTAVSRTLTLPVSSPYFTHSSEDISQGFTWNAANTCLYYFVPPADEGETDTLLAQFIKHAKLNLTKVVYCSSSGVYGDHQGQWITEDAACHIVHDRQRRRLDAEQQWQLFCQQRKLPCLIVRVAGIYGPQRLPITAAKAASPLIIAEEAPFSNHIYVADLAKIIALLAAQSTGIFTIADGQPQKMGSLQCLTAEALALPAAPFASFKHIWQEASPMKREFMAASKRLDIHKLQNALPTLELTSLAAGVHLSVKGI